MKNELKIEPRHLALTGTAIIILGVLVPSLFIDPFSTIGISIIIGLLVLLVAYVFFSVNIVRSRGLRSLKWLLLPVLLTLVLSGGFYASHKYQENIRNKVYAVDETIKMPGFNFRITNVAYIKTPLDTKGIDLNDRKDCSGLPTSSQAYHDCDWYNWPRRNAQNYLSEYPSRAVINYEIMAKDVVDTKYLDIEVLPDSGRQIKHNASIENDVDTFSFLWELGLDENYKANPKSDFGGNVNQGLTRNGTIGIDLKDTEQVLDVIVKYRGETRTVRIFR